LQIQIFASLLDFDEDKEHEEEEETAKNKPSDLSLRGRDLHGWVVVLRQFWQVLGWILTCSKPVISFELVLEVLEFFFFLVTDREDSWFQLLIGGFFLLFFFLKKKSKIFGS
jgi:hypothetical protein